MIRLSTQDKTFFSSNYTEKLEQIRALGFDGFEADGRMLLNDMEALREAVKATGVPVTSVCGGYQGWIGDFDEERRNNGILEISEILRGCAEIGAAGIVVPAAWGMYSLRLPPLVRKRSVEEDERVLLDSLTRLDKVCGETGTHVFLEPLNRYEDYMLNHLSDGIELIEKGNLQHVQLTADFYHMSIEEPSIADSLRQAGSRVGHIHIGDTDRYQPGHAHMDFVDGFKALKEIGYEGTFAFEHRILGEDERELYKNSVLYIRDCMRKAGI
ncbi:MAG: sugar phosphate isomerase/epimerase [Clostridia bacterium]